MTMEAGLKKDYFWCIDPIDGTLAFHPERALVFGLHRAGIPAG